MSKLNVNDLKNTLNNLIDNSKGEVKDILNILYPISDYVNNSLFVENLDEIIKIIITDRNNDQVFTFEDVKLIGSDMVAISSLMNCVLTLIACLPTVNISKDNGDIIPILAFKIFTYVFLVLIPNKTKMDWTNEQKKAIVNIVLSIYNMLEMSGVIKNTIKKIRELFVRKGWCKCICTQSEEVKQQVLEKELPILKTNLDSHLYSFRSMKGIVQNNK